MPPSVSSAPDAPPAPLGDNLLSHWQLDPSITFLNHGCFGAAPREILATQSAWRERLEARPVERLDRGRDELLAGPKLAIGRFLGMRPDDFGFVTNATGGVNAVLRSLSLEPGDELVTTNHVYGAIRQTLRYVAEVAGARLVEVEIPLPVSSPDEIVAAVADAVTERARLVVLDHVTSSTAVVLPLERIIEACGRRGVDVLVDGAHGPGMLDLDVEGLGAAYYTGNLHKWVCAPKGAAFLWVRSDRQDGIHPNTISHFLGEGLAAEFAWQGTRDVTPWLCAADVIAWMETHFGWDRVRRHNHEMAVWVQAMLARAWGVEPSTPEDGSMLGSMTTLPLPGGAAGGGKDPPALQARLYDHHRLEVPIIEWSGRWWIRASCQVYNTPDQYERLAGAVLEECRS